MRPRIAVVFPGDPRSPATWSGTPAGLCAALEELGVEVIPLSAEPGGVVDFITKNFVAARRMHRAWRGSARATISFSRAIARASPELARVNTWISRRRLKKAQPVDAVVQIGTGYSLPNGDFRIATFEDLTVLQALALGYPELRALSRRAILARIDNQKRAYDAAFACCMTSSWAAGSLMSGYSVPPGKVHVVGIGRNHDVEAGERNWDTPRFLFVGTNWHGKNGDGVLQAFARLRREIPDATLDIVGDHPELDIEGVTTYGHLHRGDPRDRQRMNELFQQATCFVLPSRYEAAAIAYVEAGNAGLPCIGTSVGGAYELIGEAGRIVHPLDDEGLFEAMRQLSDPQTASALGRLARQRAPLFTWKAVAGRVLRALSLPGFRVDPLAAPPYDYSSPVGSQATASPPHLAS